LEQAVNDYNVLVIAELLEQTIILSAMPQENALPLSLQRCIGKWILFWRTE